MSDNEYKHMYVVHLGGVTLQGNKPGSMLMAYDMFEQMVVDLTAIYHDKQFSMLSLSEYLSQNIRNKASAFGTGRGKQSFGRIGVYYIAGKLDDNGMLIGIRGDGTYMYNPENLFPMFSAVKPTLDAFAIANKAFGVAEHAKKMERKENDALTNALAVLQSAYQTCAPADKMAFRLWVFDQIAKRK